MNKSLQLPELPYVGNEQRKLTLHLVLQIMGKIRMALTPRKNHWWYITEYVDTLGITTGPIPYNSAMARFTLTLNVHNHQLDVINSKGESDNLKLEPGITVAEVYTGLMEILKKMGIEISIFPKPFDLGIDKRFDALTEHHHYSKTYTKSFWQVLVWVDSVFKTFSGRYYGKTCPVHLYWHSLDLAVTRFSGKKGPPMDKNARLSDKDAYTHECISFGFWAGDGNIREPAFYSYTYPAPEGLAEKPLQPSIAKWMVNNGSPLAVIRYHDLIKEENPQKQLLDFMESAYQAGASMAGWDIENLKTPPLSGI